MSCQFAFADQHHEAEAAGIVVNHVMVVGEMEHHMVMLGIMGLPVVEIADCGGVFCVGRVDCHAAAHAEMDHQHLAAVERAEQIFGAALERGDRAAFEAGDEIGREREAQIGAALFDMQQFDPRHHGFKAASNRFYLRQFRHFMSQKAGLWIGGMAQTCKSMAFSGKAIALCAI